MAIEPIGSMTTVQMQSAVKVQTKPTVAEGENKEVISTDSATPKVDELTASVAKTSESNTSGEENSERENTASENEAIKRMGDNISKNMVDGEAVFGVHEGNTRVTIKLRDKEEDDYGRNKIIRTYVWYGY